MDIILGPPKTAFASASPRNIFKNPSADTSEEPPASNKRFSFHERLPKDRDTAEGEKREGKYNGAINRRLGKDGREDWQNNRQQRHYDQEEGDRGARRNGDRDRQRWDKQSKDQEVGADTKRQSRDVGRREGRGRFEQPWIRGEKAQDGADDVTKVPNKQHGWRRDKGSGRGPEWDRPSKAEQDPEWMDSTVPNEPSQAHTQEEFQRWKESMKAGTEGREKVFEKQEELQQPDTKKPEPPPMPAFLEVSQIESGMDKFFPFYGEKKTSSEPKPAEVKAHRKPRFAALFSPQPEDGPKDASFVDPTAMVQASSLPTSQAVAVPTDTNKIDQEHFQRVLQMLAGRSSNSTPQSAAIPKPSKDTITCEQPRNGREEQQSSLAELFQERHHVNLAGDRSRDGASTGISELLSPKSFELQQRAAREPTPNREADLLLRLMQQSRIGQDSELSPAPRPERSGSTTNPAALPGSVSQHLSAESSNRNRPIFFDSPPIPHARLSPSIPHPPGFDHMTAPPPNWQNPAARLNAAYAAGPSMPPSHIMQPPSHQQMPPPLPPQRQRKYTGDGIGPALPLGMANPVPPPRFMNVPLHPGFAPNMPQTPVRARNGRGGPPQFPDTNGMLPSHLMDLLASGQRGGGGGGRGQYR